MGDGQGLTMGATDSVLNDNLVYSSPKIFERRRRILSTTRDLIAQRGYDGFNIRELCQQAKVAPQTVYKAFESKERLIALAIRQHFTSFIEAHTFRHEAGSLTGVIERLIVSDRHMHGSREFAVALVSIFFSQTADKDLQVAARLNILITLQPWAEALSKRGDLRAGLTVDAFVEAIVALLFNASLEWCRGNLSSEKFLNLKLLRLLTFASGATRGAGRKEIDRHIDDLLGERTILAGLRADAGGRGRVSKTGGK